MILTAVGAYQLQETLRASDRLLEREIGHSVVCMLEPRRFAELDGPESLAATAPPEAREALYPAHLRRRLFVGHPRAAVLGGVLRALDTGAETRFLGYRGEGGTLDAHGMLFVNGQSWVHLLDEAARLLRVPREELLTASEREVLDRLRSPQGVVF